MKKKITRLIEFTEGGGDKGPKIVRNCTENNQWKLN